MNIENIFTQAVGHDVESLRNYLLGNPGKPFLAVGSGGMYGVAEFVTLMYCSRSGLARTLTPLEFNSVSDEVLGESKILLFSAGGHNNDIKFAAKRALSLNPEGSACLCLHGGEKNKLIPLFAKAGASQRVFCFDSNVHDGFVSCDTPLMCYAILTKVFSNSSNFASLAESHDRYFSVVTASGEDLGTESLAGVEHFTILNAGWGAPVAELLEGKFVESGWASGQVTDYRNYCHGRFIFTSNHLANSAVVMLISPREKALSARILAFLPKDTKVVLIETGKDGPEAGLDLAVKMTGFFEKAAESVGVNPDSPKNPGRIDKRAPIWVPFAADLKKAGPLKTGSR